MIKQTRAGKLPTKAIMQGRCTYCKAEYEAEMGDLDYHPDQRDGDYYTCNCQTDGCNSQVYFTKKK